MSAPKQISIVKHIYPKINVFLHFTLWLNLIQLQSRV